MLTFFITGYVWLVRSVDKPGTLHIYSSKQQDCPISEGLYPLICLDVWEHSYYLKHQYKRADYISDWWQVLDWKSVEDLDIWWSQQGAYNISHTEL